MNEGLCIGIVGGDGMLGRAIALGLLEGAAVAPVRLWISNRSGQFALSGRFPEVTVTSDNQLLAEACDVVVLSVPPAEAGKIGITGCDSLFVSVMAGVTLKRLEELVGSKRIVRAMSSPAASMRLAYSPWIAGVGIQAGDREIVRDVFGALGTTDELSEEAHVDVFTALTGPVPGFVAYFAEAMGAFAVSEGIEPEVADRATRQLFKAAGLAMAEGDARPADHVQEMVDYAGTTAAGLTVLRQSGMTKALHGGLAAAVARTREIGNR